MKVLVFVKATPNSEKGIVPTDKLQKMLEEMGKYNEQLIKAGIMKEADGLKPSSAAKRIVLSDEKPATVIDGPFAETKELVAGYWVWNVKSMDEAVEWAKRCPPPMPGEEGVLEIRPTYSEEEFAEFVGVEKPKTRKTKKSKKAKKAKAKPARARSKK